MALLRFMRPTLHFQRFMTRVGSSLMHLPYEPLGKRLQNVARQSQMSMNVTRVVSIVRGIAAYVCSLSISLITALCFLRMVSRLHWQRGGSVALCRACWSSNSRRSGRFSGKVYQAVFFIGRRHGKKGVARAVELGECCFCFHNPYVGESVVEFYQ
jgi:hypothetical protein